MSSMPTPTATAGRGTNVSADTTWQSVIAYQGARVAAPCQPPKVWLASWTDGLYHR